MTVLETRVAITTREWDQLVEFCRDGLGLEPGDLWTEHGRGLIFAAGRATLEVFDEGQAAAVDEVEVGRRVSGQVRFSFQVEDVNAALDRALKHGGRLVSKPVMTPWNDLNARIQTPNGLQVTLFQAMGEESGIG